MSADRSPSTRDIRSHAVERGRHVNSKHKWCPKFANGVAVVVNKSNSDHSKPAPRHKSPVRRHQNEKPMRRAKLARKQNALCDRSNDSHGSSTLARKQDVIGYRGHDVQDSSTDDDVSIEASSPFAEDDIKYSFDAARGPSEGADRLGFALDQAVERYEDRQTTKLVSEEYEVLDDFVPSAADASDHEDDDFEWV